MSFGVVWGITGAKQSFAANAGLPKIPSVSNGAQACENARKKSFLNYKSAALFG